MSAIFYKNLPYGAGGSNVEANPSGSATGDLTKVGIDGTVYDVTDADAVHSADKGVANGVASLDATGRVPSTQLPSYVDDVLEYASQSAFPATGESGKIYIALDTNKTYRWSGSAYVEISESLALGTTHSTAAYGDDAVSTAEPSFSEASTRANLAGSGEKLSVILGKIKKWFTDLKDLAFIGKDGNNSKKLLRGDGTWTDELEGKNVIDDLTMTNSTNDSGIVIKAPAQDTSGIYTRINFPNHMMDDGNLCSHGYLSYVLGDYETNGFGSLAGVNKDGTTSTKYLRGDGTWQAFPTIPAEQVNSDWNASSGVAQILNKPSLATVATSGSYNDLSDKPTIPTNTDEKVKQENTTGSADYRVLLSNGANDTTETKTARKSTNLKFNPSTGNLQATQLNGVTIGSSPKFTDTNTTYTLSADDDNNKIKLTPSSGSAQSITVPYATVSGTCVGQATSAVNDTDGNPIKTTYSKTDENVKQENTTTNASYRILFSNGANNTTETKTARKSANLTYNPSTKKMDLTNSGKISAGYVLFPVGSYDVTLTSDSPISANRTLKLPNESGTLATREYLNSNYSTDNATMKGTYNNDVYYRTVAKSAFVKVLTLVYSSKAISTLNTWYTVATLPSGYYPTSTLETAVITKAKKYCNLQIDTSGNIKICARESIANGDLVSTIVTYI